jgi:hypothetical protein
MSVHQAISELPPLGLVVSAPGVLHSRLRHPTVFSHVISCCAAEEICIDVAWSW